VLAEAHITERISHEPLGVVGNISAWNYPYYVGSNVFVPALLTGNAVLYKPSEYATLTGLEIARLLHEAGVPPDAFIALVGDGEVGAALVGQRIDGLFFTGSHATGMRIAAALADRLVKLQLELGGKDPTYVCEDADVRIAAESLADGAMYNSGQSCCSVERIYVHERVHDAFSTSCAASRSATRPTSRPTSARSPAPPSSRCWKRRWPTRWPRAAGCGSAATASSGRATGSSRPCSPAPTTPWS
jgi:acyl-CoA reductase-like NAD-dependent aldehyde dehydrogenase